MDPFFPDFYGAYGPFEKCTLRFGPKKFVLFQKIDLVFDGSLSWNAQHNRFEIVNEATGLFPPLFFGFLMG